MESAGSRKIIEESQSSSALGLASSHSALPQSQAGPLVSLLGYLNGTAEAVEQLQTALKKAREVTDPSFFSPSSDPQVKKALADPQVKKELAQLLGAINPNKTLDKQIAIVVAAFKSLDIYRGLLTTEVKKREAPVTDVYEKLKQQFLNDCKQCDANLEKKRDALIKFHADVARVDNEYAWLGLAKEGAANYVDRLSLLNHELEKEIARLDEIKIELPAGMRSVAAEINSQEQQSNYDDVMQAEITFVRQMELLRLVDLNKSKTNIDEMHKQLKTLKKKYIFADEKYAALLKQYGSTTLKAERQNLVNEVNAFLENDNDQHSKNEGAIFAVIQAYLNDAKSEQGAKAELNQLIDKRRSVTGGFKDELERKQRKTNSLNEKIKKILGEVERLDYAYPELSSLSEETCVTELKNYREQIEGQEKLLEEIEQSLLPFQERIASAYAAEQQIITSRLTMLTSGDLQLNASGEAIQKIISQLPHDVAEMEEIYNQAKNKLRKCDAALKQIEQAKQQWQDVSDGQERQVRKAAYEMDMLLTQSRNIKQIDDDLRGIKEKWDDPAFMFDFWFQDVLAQKVLPKGRIVEFPEQEVFFNTMKPVASSLNQSFVRLKNKAAPSDNDLVKSLFESYKRFIHRFIKTKEYFAHIVPEVDGKPLALFASVKQYADKLTDRLHLVEACRENFYKKIQKVDWEKSELFKDVQAASAASPWLRQFEKNIEELQAQNNALFAQSNEHKTVVDKDTKSTHLEELLEEKFTSIQKLKNSFSSHISNLRKLERNLKDYLIKFDRYKEKEELLNLTNAKLTLVSGELGVRKADLDAIANTIATCETIAENVQKIGKKINKNHTALLDLVKNLGIGSECEKIRDKLAAIQIEKNFQDQVTTFFDSISKVKDKNIPKVLAGDAESEAQRRDFISRGEVFTRLRHEFLYAGKSKMIIDLLREHRRVHLVQTEKGGFVDEFFTELFDENKFNTQQQLLDFFDKPFGDNEGKNDRLFACRTFNFGIGSKTKHLISDLRDEWLALVEREAVDAPGTIINAIQKDCAEISCEYAKILEKKGKQEEIDWQAQSAQRANECDQSMATVIALPQREAIMKDLVEIQRWGGENHANLACRAARMKCAIALRHGDPNLQSSSFDQYKFSYSYQALKNHLANVTTNRKADLDWLWSNLDAIAFGAGDERDKYRQMHGFMLQFYNRVRVDNRHSFTGFFGRVSRLTIATEEFLIRARAEHGLGFKNGDGDKEVHHESESGVCALYHKAEAALTSCFKPKV